MTLSNDNFASSFNPIRIGPLTLRNQYVKAATNEGLANEGHVSDRLIEFHRRIAGGGVGMTTLAYCAISEDGRTFIDQPILDSRNFAHMLRLTDAVHLEGAAACAQITHGGAFTFLPTLTEQPRPVSADGGFNPPGVMVGRWFKRAATTDDLDQLCRQFVAAARAARESGFDAVEIHMGHGYLLSQFLSPAYNHRRDEFGGDAVKRSQFPKLVLEQVLDAVGHDMAVICKMSIIEGHSKGNTLGEVIQICRELERAGAHMLVLSAGMNVESPWTIFGNRLPMRSMTAAASGVFKHLSALMALRQPSKSFEPLYLLSYSKQIRAEISMPLCYVGGVTAPEHVAALRTAGFEAIAVARALLHNPDLIGQWSNDHLDPSQCTACNLCVAEMYTDRGTHCVLTGQPTMPNH